MQVSERKNIKAFYYILGVVLTVIVLSTLLLGQGKTVSAKVFSSKKQVILPIKTAVSDDGMTKTYFFSSGNIKSNGSCLLFHERHHNVVAYSGDTTIYRLIANRTALGNTTGSKWIFCYVADDSYIIRLQFTALYGSVKNDEPVFYAGDESTLYESLFIDSISQLVIGMINLLCGIFVLICYLVMKKNTKSMSDLVYIAIDAILFGIYELTNSTAFEITFSNLVVLNAISFFILMLVSIPFIMYVKETIFEEDKIIYKVLLAYCFAEALICIILMPTGLWDLKESAILSHIAILLTGIYAITGIFNYIYRHGINKSIIINGSGLLFCCICCGIDIIRYYSTHGNNFDEIYCRVGFSVYILTLITINFAKILNEIMLGRQAEYYKKLALTDTMTHMYNHTSFIHDANMLNQNEQYAIVSMDLNNLKRVNDQEGHGAGDRYITTASAAIREAFEKFGSCYRTGGDEFAVILPKYYSDKANDLIKKLGRIIEKYNDTIPADAPNRLVIASGYAVNIPDRDTTFETVLKRADDRMYENKKAIKRFQRNSGAPDSYVDSRLM